METKDTIYSVENMMGVGSVGYVYSLIRLSMSWRSPKVPSHRATLKLVFWTYNTTVRRDYFLRKESGSGR